jgi:hypothetical protein
MQVDPLYCIGLQALAQDAMHNSAYVGSNVGVVVSHVASDIFFLCRAETESLEEVMSIVGVSASLPNFRTGSRCRSLTISFEKMCLCTRFSQCV